MDKIVINQELLLLLQKNKIIATTSNFNYRDQAVISLIKTLITMGYNSSLRIDWWRNDFAGYSRISSRFGN